jgi:flagellar L-ring protein precursor FlgH
MEKIAGLSLLSLGIWLISGCAASSKESAAIKTTPPMVTAAASSERLPAPVPGEGSLWDDGNDMSRMFVNAKARRVGDMVTIKIVETSRATNKASTKTGRSSTLDAGIDSFFGQELSYPASRPFFNPFGKIGASMESQYDGSGSTERSGALNALITARIIEILPNGNLMIEGNREVRINNENQIITLTGMIRPRDISADNMVQSTYIADARIAYSGTGILNDRQKPGWLTRILDVVWPF